MTEQTGDPLADFLLARITEDGERLALRRVVRLLARPGAYVHGFGGFRSGDEELRLLAGSYAAHPDYRAEWAV